jgi:choice-of-anchor C domain-containing protein
MKLISALAAFALALAALAGFGRHADAKLIELPLLVNGSFEEGPELPQPHQPINENSREIRGWIVTHGQIDLIGTHWQHADGKRSLDLHGSPGIGGVKQTFHTRKGQKYRVSLALSGNPHRAAGGPLVKAVTVRAAGASTEFSFDTAGRSEQDMGWLTHTWDFVAEADETTLEIYSATKEGPFAGPAIDDVRVIPVR